MDLDVRGEMEAAASELEGEGQSFESDGTDASPASSVDATDDTTEGKPADEPPAPATEEPPAAPKSESSPPDPDELPVGGSIPVPRVRKILENTRAKAKAEAEAQLQQVAWARELKREDVAEAIRVMKFANENPVEFYRAITSRLRADPTYASEVERIAAPAASQPDTPKPEADPKPQPDVLLEDGRLVYSADQQEKVLAWMERRIESKVSQKLRPLEERDQDVRAQREMEHAVRGKLAEVTQYPGMSDADNRKLVAQAMINEKIDVDTAYRKVILPKLTNTKAIEDRVRKQVLAELKTKSRASTSNPQTTGADPSDFKGKSVREILEMTADEIGFRE